MNSILQIDSSKNSIFRTQGAECGIQRIVDLFLSFQENDQSKIFTNETFGFSKVTVERPLRLQVDLSDAARTRFREACVEAKDEALANLIDHVAASLGSGPHLDFNAFMAATEQSAKKHGIKITAKRQRFLQTALAEKNEDAAPIIKKVYRPGKAEPNPIYGRFEVYVSGKLQVVEYLPDSELRDTEQVPLLEEGGIEAFFRREVLPHVPNAWIDETSAKIGYEISFTRYFYKPTPLRTLEEIRSDIEALEQETEGLLGQILIDTEAK